MAVLVVGSVALDTIETPDDRREDVLGGSATHFSIASSYFGDVQLVGVVGDDFPDSGFRLFKDHGIDTAGLRQVEGKTFRWSGRYFENPNKRETLSTDLNVFEQFSPEIPEAYRSSRFLFLANIHPALQLEVLSQVTDPELVVTDTMNLWIDTALDELTEVIAQSDILIVNDEEVKQLTGQSNLFHASKSLLERGPDYIIAKKGEHGAMMVGENECFYAPAYPVDEVIDPTGAGDSFAGGLLGYLDQIGRWNARELRKAIIYGSTMASFDVEAFSVEQLQELTRKDIETRYQEFGEMTRF